MSYSVAIVGAGAIGINYGVRLGKAGAETRFLLRRDLEAVRAHGLRVREKDQVLELRPAIAAASTEEIGPVDVVLIALKTTSNAALPRLLPPLLRADTLVVTLQNGLGNEDYLAGLIGPERVAGGICFIASTRTGPGEVTCYHPGSVTLGAYRRPPGPRVQELASWLDRAGVKCRTVDNLDEARWRKLVWNIPFNGLAVAAGGLTTDRILADPELAAEVRSLMEEVARAGERQGFSVPQRFIEQQIEVTRPMAAYAPSSLVDFQAGRAVELESIWGEALRRAQAAGVAMPHLEKLYTRLCEVLGEPKSE